MRGPEEGDDWYWANAREQNTTFGVYAAWTNAANVVEEHQLYLISSVMEHSALFAILSASWPTAAF